MSERGLSENPRASDQSLEIPTSAMKQEEAVPGVFFNNVVEREVVQTHGRTARGQNEFRRVEVKCLSARIAHSRQPRRSVCPRRKNNCLPIAGASGVRFLDLFARPYFSFTPQIAAGGNPPWTPGSCDRRGLIAFLMYEGSTGRRNRAELQCRTGL